MIGLPSSSSLAAVGVVDAGDDLDQRRLAGAVVADDGMHLTAAQLEARIGEGDDLAEMLLDPGDNQDDIVVIHCLITLAPAG